MKPNHLLSAVLLMFLAYNGAFVATHLLGESRAWMDALNEVQSALNIMEFIAVAALFVDLVIRYDKIPSTWQPWRVAGVGLCVAGMLFKWFVLYLHLSYLID